MRERLVNDRDGEMLTFCLFSNVCLINLPNKNIDHTLEPIVMYITVGTQDYRDARDIIDEVDALSSLCTVGKDYQVY